MTSRNHEIRVKVSLEELQALERKSAMFGMPISSFLRFLGLQSSVEISTKNTITYKKKR